MQDHKLPEGIGPHEGQEFALMRAGKKDVALFFELEPSGLNDILCDGFNLLKFAQFTHEDQTYFTRIVFRSGFENAALRLMEIVKDDATGIVPAREHEIGKILAYTQEQVNVYIKHATRAQSP